MPPKTYRVVLLGLLEPEHVFRGRMKALGAAPEVLDRMLSSELPFVMKRSMNLGYARRYAEAVQQAGGRVAIQEDGVAGEDAIRRNPPRIQPLERFTMCSQCGFKQLKARFCERCGHPL